MRYADAKCSIVGNGDEYVVTGPDLFTGKTVEVRFPSRALFLYRNGVSIQSAMPDLTPEEREFLISGVYYDEEGVFDDE